MKMAEASKRDEWVIIGISGVTCGGKTTLANKLKNAIAPVYIFHQDQYFYPDDSPRHVRCAGLDHNNYDVLSSLDMAAMHADVERTVRGEGGAHAACTDVRGKFHIEGKKFLVIEGFSVLNYKPIMDLCNLRYYLVLEYGECAARRALRLYEPPDIPGYFEQCVWPEHVKYRAEMEQDPRVRFLRGTQPDIFETVMADLRALPT